MKRNEQNIIMKERIMTSALKEFSENGYDRASMNHICQNGHISKGIIYHYFKDKDELYLECVSRCLKEIVQFYKKHGIQEMYDLKEYLILRMQFFDENPIFRDLFFHIVLNSPEHLSTKIQEIKEEFDHENMNFYYRFLSHVQLRDGMTYQKAIQFIDFIQNAYNHYFKQAIQNGNHFHEIVKQHENMIFDSIDMMLYGIIKEEQE